MPQIRGIALVEVAARRYASSYPEQRTFTFDLTFEPVPDASGAVLVGLTVVLVAATVPTVAEPAPNVFDSKVRYIVHLDVPFSREIAPQLAATVWDRLREDSVRLARQLELGGIPLPATPDPLLDRAG